MKQSIYARALPALCLAVVCAPAHAADAAPPQGDSDSNGGEGKVSLGDIIVTAQKTASTLQKTPMSISVVGGEAVARMAQTAADEVLKGVAGVEVQGAARGQVIAIRGLGTDTPSGVGESSVSTNFDGVYSIRAESNTLGFYDLERVEVLRGPQSTLYGRNATAGVVNMISANPKLGDRAMAITVGAGNYNLVRGEAMINLPLADTVALRVSGTGISRDGYLNNGHSDQKGAGVRAKLLWEPSADVSVLTGFEGAWLKGHGSGAVEVANFDAGKPYTTADSSIGGQDYFGYKAWSQVDWKVGPGTVTFIPAYQHGHGVNNGVFGGRGTYGQDPAKIDQGSAELRYAAAPGAPVQWIVGLYHYDYSQFTFSLDNATYGSTAGYSYNRGISNAVFGQVTVPVAPGLRLVGGMRETWDRRRASGTDSAGNIVGGRLSNSFFDYRAGVEYDVGAHSLAYVTASSAFRPGGVSPFDGKTFLPERLHAYEAGLKNRLFDNRLQFNLSGFYYDYSNYQVVDFFIGATGPNLVFYNVDARNYGLELDAQAALSAADTVNLSATYLASRIEGDLILHPSDPFTPVNFKGERLPHAPRWTVKGGYQHVFDMAGAGSLTARADARYVTRQYLAPNNTAGATQEAYGALDASLAWRSANDRYSLTAYMKNITNKAVKTGYFVGYVTVAAPKTYGVTASARF
ncbi:TonB-dependent receptor [Novosphingobium sp. SG720]|uniref:TonB-dependent receptor n=1 Tax=Novosphingobium TaxID=165696 RepID=UPI0014462652|nr:TonB-dependent receptor [Novosphingobium sp. SG720]NKJ44304.1 iron complex outermembrane receptor protein [Novosphingobium sp. SG720]